MGEVIAVFGPYDVSGRRRRMRGLCVEERTVEWRFFHELHGGWQWHQLDAAGVVIAHGSGFATHEECVRDAMRRGYVNRCAAGSAADAEELDQTRGPAIPAASVDIARHDAS
jgi:hypothetical protein